MKTLTFISVLSILCLSTCAKKSEVTADVFTGLSSGYHACAIANGLLQCWGGNAYGQLGNGLIIDSTRPARATLSGTVEHLVMTGSISCAVADGILYCWGYNAYGSIGTGDKGTDHALPTEVLGTLTHVKQISAKAQHVCALSDEGVQCWGESYDWASTAIEDSAVSISLPAIPTSIATGNYHSCALINGGVFCWGKNDLGQLGRGSTGAKDPTPAGVNGLSSGISAITAMGYSTCALLVGGSIQCWGGNDYGQLGNNTTTDSSIPVEVSRLTSGVTAIAGGSKHMLAIANGQLFSWGRNDSGQLGDNTTTDSSVPVGVVVPEGTVEILAPGAYHSCAVFSQQVYCWGSSGGSCSLGNGKPLIDSSLPVLAGPWAK